MADNDPQKETWDRYWNTEKPQYAPHTILIDRVFKHVRSKDSIIAEIGAGSGVDALEIARAGYSIVILDISGESLRLIKSKLKETGVELMAVMGDALNLPFKHGSLDFVYHQGLLEHFENPRPFLFENRRILKTDGKLLADVPQTFTMYTLKKKLAMLRGRWFAGWETQYTPNKLRRILRKAGLKVIDIYGRDYDIAPLVWLSNIETLGKTRFGRPIVPRLITKPISAAWDYFERLYLSNYIKHSIGAVAVPHENRD
ncbi:MAG: class I SAM-dependent methyltransferase [Candidatus Zixiibacteriota bacterium]|nr:MAG: class I SAM-dependent methyltransferase [candidate division Zixibacteria bacterium]